MAGTKQKTRCPKQEEVNKMLDKIEERIDRNDDLLNDLLIVLNRRNKTIKT